MKTTPADEDVGIHMFELASPQTPFPAPGDEKGVLLRLEECRVMLQPILARVISEMQEAGWRPLAETAPAMALYAAVVLTARADKDKALSMLAFVRAAIERAEIKRVPVQ